MLNHENFKAIFVVWYFTVWRACKHIITVSQIIQKRSVRSTQFLVPKEIARDKVLQMLQS